MDSICLDQDKSLPNESKEASEEASLRDEYEQLTLKLHKQKLILSVIMDIDVNDFKSVDEKGKSNIDRALDFVRAYDYIRMDDSGTNVLGIPEKPQELSYVEKRALRAKVLEELPKHYEKQLEFCRQMEPEVINPEILDNKLMDLKAREKELLTELAGKKAELCTHLEEGLEMRYGPDQKNDCMLNKAMISVEQVRAQVIETLFEEHICTMTDHVKQAMEKIEPKLDSAIAEKQMEPVEESARESDSE